ncbi:MAG: hypothetical protein HKN36_03180 [Hellea sp.]|nr:hypothetical protein [Hellea sp.]
MQIIFRLSAIVGLISVAGITAHSQESDAETIVSSLEKCAAIQSDSDRLACFDLEFSSFSKAVDEGNILVMDPSSLQDAKKEGFGLNLPSLSGLGGIFKSSDDPEIPGNVDEVELEIEKTTTFGYKKTRFIMTNGQIWEQVTTDKVRIPSTKNGNNMAVIRKAALGSFMLRINGEGKQIRVKRVK